MDGESTGRTQMGPILIGDRPLPHNSEAEVAVLGSMLLDPAEAIDVAIGQLNFPGSFYSPAHQVIFESIVRLTTERPKGGIDLVTLTDFLDHEGRLEEVGGVTYLTRLLNSVPSSANIEQYAQIVHEHAVLRRLIHTSADVVERCLSPQTSVRELVDQIETEVLGVSSLNTGDDIVKVGDVIYKAIDLLDRLHRRDLSILGIQTGFPDLDRVISGLRPGEMVVLAARPSIGKTALALNMVMNVALSAEPVPVGVFSLEMSTDLLVLRMLCSLARINLGDVRDGALAASRWQEITEKGQVLRDAPIFIDDSGQLDIVELRAKGRRMWREHNIRLLVVDYLQLLRPTTTNRNATRENEVSQMSGGLKALAKELGIPILVIAQLNRQAEQTGQRPKLSHLRESGAIEQDADIVALLHREREVETGTGGLEEGMDAELIIAKHRNGPTGIVPLTFLPQYTRFESRSPISERDVPDVGDI